MLNKRLEKVLLSFIGAQDPYARDGGEGPVLTLIKERKDFNRVILFYTNDKETSFDEIKQIISSNYPQIKVEPKPLDIDDPSSHEKILKAVRPIIQKLSDNKNPPISSYFISVSSGTPAMHAAWLLLAASGEIPANILYIRERRFITKGQPLICEVNPRTREFPDILPKSTMEELPEVPDINAVLKECGIIGGHPEIKKAIDTAAMAAQSDCSVLITGESGTGKNSLQGLFIRLARGMASRLLHLTAALSQIHWLKVNYLGM